MILVENKVVVATMDEYKILPEGKLINNCIYPMGEVFEVSQPKEIIPQKYCYTIEEGFYINEIWANSIEIQKQQAIDEYTLQLMQEGLI